jgi:hypothetical protein
MELAERTGLPGIGPATGAPGACALGTAAGHTRSFAQERAWLEGVERFLCRFWWSGHLPAAKPCDEAERSGAHWLAAWRGSRSRETALLTLAGPDLPQVLVAVSWSQAGRDLCFGMAARPTPSAAARAAVRELLQMEFGLAVTRYRAAHGIVLSEREAAALDRAAELERGDIDSLMPGKGPHGFMPEVAARRQTVSVERPGVWLATCVLDARTGPAFAAGHWTGWPLYP